jgi:hypothetical protein
MPFPHFWLAWTIFFIVSALAISWIFVSLSTETELAHQFLHAWRVMMCALASGNCAA